MRRADRLLLAALALVALAGLALASPSWWAPVPSSHADAPAAAVRAAWWSRGAALVVALGACVALLAAAAADPARARRAARAGAWAFLLAGLALASVAADRAVAGHVEARYADGAFLAGTGYESFARAATPDLRFPAFEGERAFDDLSAPLVAGPVRAQRGDAWSVAVLVRGEAWAGDALPVLSSDVPLRCEAAEVEDLRGEGTPGIGVRWRCVALGPGEGHLAVRLPQPATGEGVVLASVVPAVDVAATGGLDEALATLCLGAAGVSWIVAWTARRRAGLTPRR